MAAGGADPACGSPPAAGRWSQRCTDAVTYWIRKEAVVKATGEGLAAPLDGVRVTAPDEPPALLAYPGHEHLPVRMVDLWPDPAYRAALAVLTDRPVAVDERPARLVVSSPTVSRPVASRPGSRPPGLPVAAQSVSVPAVRNAGVRTTIAAATIATAPKAAKTGKMPQASTAAPATG